jgi:hypothetical protein
VTQLVDISDRDQMRIFKGKAVTSPDNQRQCKDAVDAIYTRARPDYIVLLDGPDVLPHLTGGRDPALSYEWPLSSPP